MIGATMAYKVRGQELYLPVMRGRYLLVGPDLPSQIEHNVFDVRGKVYPSVSVLVLRVRRGITFSVMGLGHVFPLPIGGEE